VPVEDAELPVVLPEVQDYHPKGRSPLADVPEFMNTTCPKCGGEAERDPDTMDTFVCSSWYFLRYLDPFNTTQPFAREKANAWLPIDLYIGGISHATGHLIYFRFFTKFLNDIGWLECKEPATRLFNHGMVADASGEVMSKSKGNVVSPIAVIDERGVDVSRLAMFFVAPSERPVAWSTRENLTGPEKFVTSKLFGLTRKLRGETFDLKCYFKSGELSDADRTLYIKLNQSIKRVSESFEQLQFNTAISALMELVRDFDHADIVNETLNDQIILKTVQMIAPLTPHLAEEMWESAGCTGSVFKSAWPEFDAEAIIGDTIDIAVQVNGKLRATVCVPVDCDQETAEEAAFGHEKIQAYTKDKEIVKRIFVRGRLLNIVVKG
jgi:leucyl-tRNA synthetase